MKKIFKLTIIPMVILLLTSCNLQSKQALGYTEKTINISKDINNISNIRYLGQGIYAVNTSTDKNLSKYKLMDSSGKLLSDNIFYYMDSDSKFNDKGTIPVMVTDYTKHKKRKYKLINIRGEFVGKSYDVVSPIEKDMYEVLEGDTYGYIDSTGKEITQLIKMSSATLNNPNCRPYKNEKGKYQFLNKEGKNIAPYEFDDFEYTKSSKDLISVYKNNKWGFMNKQGTFVKDFQFEEVHGFCEDLISVKQNGKWGCMDRSLNVTIPFKFDKPVVFIGGIAIVDIDSKEGPIDKKGNFLISPKFDCIKGDFHEGYSMVQLGNKTGIIDIKGNFIVKPNNKYGFYSWDSKSINMVTNLGTTHLMDIQSKKVIDLEHKQVSSFKNNIVLISENNKWGIIDRQGNSIAPTEFDEFLDFTNDFAIVKKQNKYGIIDIKGKYKIPLKYDEIKYICKNYYAVKKEGKWGIIDINEKVIKPIEYDNASVVELKEKSKFQAFLMKKTKLLVLKFKN
ncbi:MULTISPECIES: WG repeat-containing protein [Clostridium]|uniref:WG repeat-containing protein n=1 Tax=Clostridium TaxID=1485 RepID=UPI0004DA4F48|nr:MULTISPECIES: WG repeat-containing protein [Clostridium]AYF55300.1 WG repeat-containing protein [Clostridium novyi]KEI06328.1 hypothetical protein Z957_p0105 [Clostridium sp. K25]